MTEKSIRSFISYEEIFGQRATPRAAELLFERMNEVDAMRIICSYALLIHNEPIVAMSARQQRELTAPFEKEPWIARVGQRIARGDVLIHEIQLGIMARLAIKYSGPWSTNGDLADIFIRACLCVNSLHGATHFGPRKPIPKTPKTFIQMELQSSVLPNERLSNVLHRYHKFITFSRSLGADDPDFINLDEDFMRILGISYEDYAASAYALFTQFLNVKSADQINLQGGPFVRVDDLLASIPSSTALAKWIGRFSMSIENFRDKYSGATITYRSTDAAPFMSCPLLVAGGCVLLCPMPSLLQNTAGTGLFFALFDGYKREGDESAAEKLSRLYGRFLEHYCFELLTYASRNKPMSFAKEIPYRTPNGESKSTDVVVCDEAGLACFVEVSKKRFNLTKTLIEENAAGLADDIDKMIIEKAQQIARSYRDLVSGLFSYPFQVGRVIPVVVVGQRIAGIIGLRSIVDERLSEKRVFADLPFESLTYLDIENLEDLAVMFDGELDLQKLILEKINHNSPLARGETLNNYLFYFRPDVSRYRDGAANVLPGHAEYFRDVIMKTVDSWGIPVDWEASEQFLKERDAGYAARIVNGTGI